MVQTIQTSIPLEIISIKEDGYHIFVNVMINGITVRMLLDTGASRTVFDEAAIKVFQEGIALETNEDKATGLGTNTLDNYIGIVQKLSIGELHLKDYQVGIIDLAHVNTSYCNIDILPITGVVGSDLLVKYEAVIDLKKKVLILNYEL